MKGAMTEPCAKISSPPMNNIRSTRGRSHNFLRTFKNVHSSTRNGIEGLLELVPKAFRRRTRWFSGYPIRIAPRIESLAHRIATRQPLNETEWREDQEIQDGQDDWTHDGMEQRGELHPDPVEGSEPSRADERHQTGQSTQREEPHKGVPPAEVAEDGKTGEKDREDQSEVTVRGKARHHWGSGLEERTSRDGVS